MRPLHPRTPLLFVPILLFAAFTLSLMPSFAAALVGTVSGIVFRDYNENGTREAGEPGIAAIVVTGTDELGDTVTVTTDADGAYSIAGLAGNHVRVEMSLPADGSLDYLKPAVAGGTTVQFVDTTNGNVGGVDAGLNNPVDYCQAPADANIALTYFTSGDPLPAGQVGDAPSLLTIPYNASGNGQNFIVSGLRATGATWGLAYEREGQRLYSAAFLKRHVGLGPAGLGGIYITDFSTSTATTSTFMDLAAAPYNVSVGTVPSNAERGLPTNPATPSRDIAVYNSIGRLGLGDLDISDDGTTLYTVNINEKRPYSIVIDGDNNPATPPTAGDVLGFAAPILNPACSNGDFYPFGLDYHDGNLYMGGVCNAETGTAADLEALIFRYNPTAPADAPTEILRFALNYPKGFAGSGCLTPEARGFNPWWNDTDTLPPACNGFGLIVYPQPWLTDIEFDTDGSMIIGFEDRNVQQVGIIHYGLDPASNATYYTMSGGDMLRAYVDGNGDYQLEANAAAGGAPTGGANNNQGPGGGEYYFQENLQALHQETSHGGFAMIPGTGEVAVSVMDPLDIHSGGIRWMNNSTGAVVRGYGVYFQNTPGSQGKGGGMGEPEVLCDPAPVEIGDRIWYDTDRNGVQDPEETGFADVIVGLYTVDATLVATATTDSAGNYLFSNDATRTDTPSANYGITELESVGDYRVGVLASNFVAGAVLEAHELSPANTTELTINSTCEATAVGSGGTLSPYSAPVSTTGAGHNDHTVDCGFNTHVSVGDYIWEDINGDGVQDDGEPDLADVTVACYLDANNDDIPDSTTPVVVDETDANGMYACGTLIPNHYVVVIDVSNFETGGVLEDYIATVGGIDPDDEESDEDSNCSTGEVTTVGGVTGIFVPATTLSHLDEPTGDGHSGSGGHDANGNGTVDCGFHQRVTLGNYIWEDANANGQQEDIENPLEGVGVSCYADADDNGVPDSTTPETTDITDFNGFYLCEDLLPGTYVVVVDNSNFDPGGALEGYIATQGGADADTNESNSDSNCAVEGITTSGGVTGVFVRGTTLSADDEPLGDDTGGAAGGDSSGNGTVDCGFYQNVALGNIIWEDTNGDGHQNNGEPAIEGVEVACYLDANNDNVPDSTAPVTAETTDASGNYVCDGLIPGNYIVVVEGSNFDLGGPLEDYYGTISASDPDDADNNTDSNCAAGEPIIRGGVEGIFAPAVTLITGGEPLDDDTSGPSGDDNDGNGTVDCGFYQQMAMGNYLWEDANANGTQNANESPLVGVAVACYADLNHDNSPDSTTAVATSVTNSEGNYLCNELAPGTYVVVVAGSNFEAGGILEDYLATVSGGKPDDNPNDTDSNCTAGGPTTRGGVTGVFVSNTDLYMGEEPIGDGTTGPAGSDGNGNGTIDCGFYQQVSIGNYIWEDADADGQQDADEALVMGVEIACYADANNDNRPDSTTPIATDTSDKTGLYLCTDLTPGNYVIVIADSNFDAGGVLAGRSATIGGADPDTNASNTDSNCAPGGVTTNGGVTGIFVPSTTLNTRGEPLGDNTSGPGGDDNNGNGTVDCGFTALPTAVTLSTVSTVTNEFPMGALVAIGMLAIVGVLVVARKR